MHGRRFYLSYLKHVSKTRLPHSHGEASLNPRLTPYPPQSELVPVLPSSPRTPTPSPPLLSARLSPLLLRVLARVRGAPPLPRAPGAAEGPGAG
ncbi:hypothetical protein BDA96_02G434000 [Sorghum bicolor]|uniref:Uncharacterized protein n=2 Tax=Sorghum bicolor TaxID=4558 RepID=A0A921UVQ7_SORBI|nr:hypothetical protein BDA96_02G434000 [Sorghum bicolor]KXG36923.1 hypothetical protein SORBI_3002G413900 [Sorghum bicolor]